MKVYLVSYRYLLSPESLKSLFVVRSFIRTCTFALPGRLAQASRGLIYPARMNACSVFRYNTVNAIVLY